MILHVLSAFIIIIESFVGIKYSINSFRVGIKDLFVNFSASNFMQRWVWKKIASILLPRHDNSI